MSGLVGVDLNEGSAWLEKTVSEIWWRGRSPFLCHACEQVIPGFRYEPVRGPRAPELPRGGSGRRVALALASDPAARSWAADRRLELLLPPPALTRRSGDKIELVHLAEAAGVATPRSTVLHAASTPGSAPAWGASAPGWGTFRPGADVVAGFWGSIEGRPIVAQLPRNDLAGGGTRLIRDEDDLHRCLAAWAGEELKLAEHVDGLSLTLSGCVGREWTLVSGISHQLVGYPRLTRQWGAHCGNQLLDDADLPEGAAERCRAACFAVGEELRRRGLRGLFGLDVVLTADSVVVIELNPRIQSVTSLLSFAEVEAGLLPMPGLHVLAYLFEQLPCAELRPRVPGRHLSQLVASAPEPGTVERVPEPGRYRLTGAGVVPAGGGRFLSELDEDEALVWPFVKPGDLVVPGDRLLALQFPRMIADVCVDRRLGDWAQQWLDVMQLHVRVRS